MQKNREKFSTTLDTDLKRKLNTLAQYYKKDCNDLLEKWIARQWEEFKHEVANESELDRGKDKRSNK